MKQHLDTDIISGFHKGSSRAFDVLFDMFFPALCYFANKLIDDRQEAEDIVLDTFQKLWARREHFETMPNIKAFLYITVRNTCLNYIRHKETQRKRTREMLKLLPEPLEEDAEQHRIRAEVLQNIYSAIEKLPRKCREVFELSYFEGMKAQEIAEQLQISESTVRNQKVRALQLLKTALTGRELLVLFLIMAQAGNTLHINA
jgi:RNA polymerase sigma-70 factor (ECF subfamily)